MRAKKISVLQLNLLCLLLVMFTIGCSGGGSDPVTPLPTDPSGSAPPLLTGQTEWTHSPGNVVLWGLYEFNWDTARMEVVAVPMRTAGMTVNILKFLQLPDGDPANLKIAITDNTKFQSEGILGLDVSITHPFDTLNLTGFDVMGVIIGDGSNVSDVDSGVRYAGENEITHEKETTLLNADGYTRWMNPSEFPLEGLHGFTEGNLGTKDADFTATINGYKYFAHGLGAVDDIEEYFAIPENTTNRGAFLPDSTNTRNYYIQFPMDGGSPQLLFQYAMLAHWKGAGIPDPGIDDFPLEANTAEVVCLSVDASESTTWWTDTGSGGDIILDMILRDWQGELSSEDVISQIESLAVDSASAMLPSVGVTFSQQDLIDALQPPDGPYFAHVRLEIADVSPAGLEEEVLITVRSADPISYDQGFGVPIPSDAHLAGYSRVSVPVDPNGPPVIISCTGETEVWTCTEEKTYTVVAEDPNGDDLEYYWEVVKDDEDPTYPDGPTPDTEYTVDWSEYEPDPYPALYDVCVKVSDGIGYDDDRITVTKSNHPPDISGEITGLTDVYWYTGEETYTVDAADLDECDIPLDYYWEVLPANEDPTFPDDPTEENTYIVDWSGYAAGDWQVCVKVDDGHVEEAPTKCLPVTKHGNDDPVITDCFGETGVWTCTEEKTYVVVAYDPNDDELEYYWQVVEHYEEPTYPDPPSAATYPVNWLSYDFLTWDVCVKVSDGSGYDECIVEVIKSNHAPVLYDPTGPTEVDGWTGEVTYVVDWFDLDDDCEDYEFKWDVVPSGMLIPDYDPPLSTTYTCDVNWSAYDFGDWDVFAWVSDGKDYDEEHVGVHKSE